MQIARRTVAKTVSWAFRRLTLGKRNFYFEEVEWSLILRPDIRSWLRISRITLREKTKRMGKIRWSAANRSHPDRREEPEKSRSVNRMVDMKILLCQRNDRYVQLIEQVFDSLERKIVKERRKLIFTTSLLPERELIRFSQVSHYSDQPLWRRLSFGCITKKFFCSEKADG